MKTFVETSWKLRAVTNWPAELTLRMVHGKLGHTSQPGRKQTVGRHYFVFS